MNPNAGFNRTRGACGSAAESEAARGACGSAAGRGRRKRPADDAPDINLNKGKGRR